MPSYERRREREQPLLAIPAEVVRIVRTGEIPDEIQKLFSNEYGRTARLYTDNERLPGVGKVQFSIDYRQYETVEWHDVSDMLLFQYNDDNGTPLAEMHFAQIDLGVGRLDADGEFAEKTEREFSLTHRAVLPELRGKAGIGSRLLQQSEMFFQQLSDMDAMPLRISIPIRQREVVAWALKNGYEPKSSRDTLVIQRMVDRPDEFEFEDIIDARDGELKQGFIFQRGTKDHSIENAITIDLIKKLHPTPTEIL